MKGDEKTNTPAPKPIEKTLPNSTFPARILIPTELQEGPVSDQKSEFSFDTLPVL